MGRQDIVRKTGYAVAGLVCCGVLTGCGTAGTPGFEAPEQSSGYLSSLGNLVAFNKLFPGSAPLPQTEATVECPTMDVQDGTSSVRIYSGDQDNTHVRYGFSLGEIARECSKSGDQLIIKVGIEGRVLIGPVGSPGSFSVPVRIAVRNDATQKVVFSQLNRITETVPPGETQAGFTYVSQPFAVPIVPHPDEDYVILVGYDPTGKGIDPAKPTRRKKHL